jgi:hypothetical protein
MALTYTQFRQLVHRYPRTPLLRAIAEQSAALERARRSRENPQDTFTSAVQPFTLAGVARTCLAAANEYRRAQPASIDVGQLCADYVDINDLNDERGPDLSRARRLLTRLAYEQFPGQYSLMENLSRSYALFNDYAIVVDHGPTADDWRQLLGVGLDEFMRIGFTVYAAALRDRGSVSKRRMETDYGARGLGGVDPARAFDVLQRHFAWGLEDHASYARQKELRGLEKWSPNPLQAAPLVSLGDEYLAPATHMLMERISPAGLYFIGAEAWHESFTKGLGTMFERYVGDHLRLIKGARVHAEIEYDKGQKLSCDFMVVMPEFVLLVEAKASRPILDFRAGNAQGEDDTERKLGHAGKQLRESARLIGKRHQAFRDIPADRPMGGLAVTLEPYFLMGPPAGEAAEADPLPIATIWAHELECLAAALMNEERPGDLLRGLFQQSGGSIRDRLHALAYRRDGLRNPILDASWARWSNWPRDAGVNRTGPPDQVLGSHE